MDRQSEDPAAQGHLSLRRNQRKAVDPAELVRLGLFLRLDFLATGQCTMLCQAMESAASAAAAVSIAGVSTVNEEIRRTQVVQTPAESTQHVREQLALLIPDLASYFGVQLSGYQEPQFLLYHPGGFFHPHCDNSGDPRQPERIRRRKVCAVLFLNSVSTIPPAESGPSSLVNGGFTGGLLNFYYLPPEPTWENFCLPLAGKSGLLIAFRANAIHQVTPVIHGTRFTIVTWFE